MSRTVERLAQGDLRIRIPRSWTFFLGELCGIGCAWAGIKLGAWLG